LLVLTLVGPDKPGLVSALSTAVASCGGSWLESEMARLAGQFAGILLVSIPDSNVNALTAEFENLERGHSRLTIQPADPEEPSLAYRTLQLKTLGQDRPGIVRDVTQMLADRKVNILEWTTKVNSAPFSAEQIFQAIARLRVPDGVEAEELKQGLERLGEDDDQHHLQGLSDRYQGR